MTTPAGWYPDPDGSGGHRYFDGHWWTEHVAPAVRDDTADPFVDEPEPPRRKGKVIAGVLAAIVVVVFVGAAVFLTKRATVDDAAVTPKPEAPAESSVGALEPRTGSQAGQGAPTPADQTPGVGQPVRDGNFEFVVTGIDRAPAVSDTEFPELQKVAQGEFVMVKLTVTNVGADPQTFFSSFNTLSDGNTDYRSDDEAWIYLGNTLADLNPGDSIDTAVVFDVPVGTDPQSIELHDGPFSEGVTVGL